jgi:hypothetical protein
MAIKVSKPEINIREALSDLKQDTGIKGQELMRADTVAEARTAIGAGRKNLLINGDFKVNQRGWTNGTSVGNGETKFLVDRWPCYASGWTWDGHVNLTTLPNGIQTNSIYMLATTGGNGYWHPFQKIEPERWMNGREFTMSAWVKTTSTGMRLRYCDTLVCKEIGDVIPNDGVWRFITASFTMSDNMNTAGAIQFQPAFTSQSVSSGEYLEFALCQLELGSVATEFEHRSYGEELALCQRYYEVLGRTHNWAGDRAYNHSSRIVNLPYWSVTKRIDPTVIIYSGYGTANSMSGYSSGAENSVTSLSDPSKYSVGRFITLSSAITQPHIGYFHADAEL